MSKTDYLKVKRNKLPWKNASCPGYGIEFSENTITRQIYNKKHLSQSGGLQKILQIAITESLTLITLHDLSSVKI